MAEDATQTELEPAAYAGWFGSDLGRRVWGDERRALYGVMGDVAARDVLDVGAGDGRLARELTERGAHVVALDRSEAMLRTIGAAGEGRPPPNRVLGDALELPFPGESFDVTVAVTALCFIERATDAVRELARVTKPGGIVVLGELGRWSLWALARRLRARMSGGLWSGARFRTAPDLRKLLAAAGVEPGEVRGAVFYPRSLLAARLLGWADPWLGRRTTVGAAFLAVAGVKTPKNGQKRGTPIRTPHPGRSIRRGPRDDTTHGGDRPHTRLVSGGRSAGCRDGALRRLPVLLQPCGRG